MVKPTIQKKGVIYMELVLVVILGLFICYNNLSFVNHMEEQMKEDEIRQDAIFETIDKYIKSSIKNNGE